MATPTRDRIIIVSA